MALKNSAKANENRNSSIKSNGAKKAPTPKVILLISIKTPTTMRFNNRLMLEVKATEKTKTYLGKLIFLIKSPFPTIDVTLVVVSSAKNDQTTIPSSRYTPELGTP